MLLSRPLYSSDRRIALYSYGRHIYYCSWCTEEWKEFLYELLNSPVVISFADKLLKFTFLTSKGQFRRCVFPLQIRQVLFIMSIFFTSTWYFYKSVLYSLVYLFIWDKLQPVSFLIVCDVS